MDEMLVVFCDNFLEIILSFVIGELKFPFFVDQNLNSIIIFILERREYTCRDKFPPSGRKGKDLFAYVEIGC